MCTFFNKVGACRHGDTCTKIHNKPEKSAVLNFKHLWAAKQLVTEEDQAAYEKFYDDFYTLCSQYGKVLDMIVAENQSSHLIGNVMVQFSTENEAIDAAENMTNTSFNNKILQPEFSPVINLREARCKAHDADECQKHAQCNFLHVIPIPVKYKSMLSAAVTMTPPKSRRLSWDTPPPERLDLRDQEPKKRRSRSRGRSHDRSRSRSHSRGRRRHHSSPRRSGYYESSRQLGCLGKYPPPVVPIYTSIYSIPPGMMPSAQSGMK